LGACCCQNPVVELILQQQEHSREMHGKHLQMYALQKRKTGDWVKNMQSLAQSMSQHNMAVCDVTWQCEM